MTEAFEGSTSGPPLSLAVYGHVRKDGGSVASANYLVLERLLDLGHRVEFHGIGGFNVPVGLIGRPGFDYRPTTLAATRLAWGALERLIPTSLKRVPEFALSLISNALHERKIARFLADRHGRKPFDALLVLGTLAPFHVEGLPCVSWPQGPPDAEWEALASQKQTAIRYGGRWLFWTLKYLYRHKSWVSLRQYHHSDVVIGCSEWSAKAWVRSGVPEAKVRAVPYAYDLKAFRPVERSEEFPRVVRFLWLGRIVPRKRLDLLLDAFSMLRAERNDVELLIVGQFAYPRGLRRLLDDLVDRTGIVHRPHVPREEIPDLFRSVDVVVQPSENENLGSAVLEGICCGRPAVVGPSNGSKDYLGESCVVFKEYTPASLKEAMWAITVALGEGRENVATSCRAAAERFLSVPVVTDQILAALHDARHPAGR